jgi:hypothetical protein
MGVKLKLSKQKIMKKKQITFDRKLSLDRQIVGKLDALQMDAIAGGVTIQTATCTGRADEYDDESRTITISCTACSCGCNQ